MKAIYLFLFFISMFYQVQAQKDSADFVNPFIGASTNIKKAGASHGLGKTFPGAATPFGLVQIGPNTITGGDNGPGYSYENPTIKGFAFTQMSGIGWYGDLGNFLVMPTTGELKISSGRVDYPEEGYRSRYAKKNEVGKEGYHEATLTDYNICAEATVAPHSGILRFTFPKNQKLCIQIDLARRVGGTSTEQYIKVLGDYIIQGWMITSPVFDKIAIRLDQNYAEGKQFRIEAKNNSLINRFIQRATLYGKAYNKCYLDYKDIKAGVGNLFFLWENHQIKIGKNIKNKKSTRE